MARAVSKPGIPKVSFTMLVVATDLLSVEPHVWLATSSVKKGRKKQGL